MNSVDNPRKGASKMKTRVIFYAGLIAVGIVSALLWGPDNAIEQTIEAFLEKVYNIQIDISEVIKKYAQFDAKHTKDEKPDAN